MRLQTDAVNQNYAEWLARLSYDLDLRGRIALPPYMTQLQDATEFKEQVFPSLRLQRAHSDPAFFRDRAILTFRNDMVNDFNADILHTMPARSMSLILLTSQMSMMRSRVVRSCQRSIYGVCLQQGCHRRGCV